MRALLLLATIGTTTLAAQASPPHAKRWEAGVAMLAGIEPMVGGTFAVRALDQRFVRVAAEVGGFVRYGGYDIQCLNPSPGGCANSLRASAPRLGTLALRATVPLPARWYVLAEGGAARGTWEQSTAGTVTRTSSGLGVGRDSRNGAQGLELRWMRIGAPTSIETGWRLGWSYRW